ncbi:MAG: acetylglutamate kinase [Phycisphaerales bacterium]|nr:acetylglutamate kinase [Phycisphaerales bacterium]MCB9837206.1 acetylglutamate kinase [Phycisphaera sp.]
MSTIVLKVSGKAIDDPAHSVALWNAVKSASSRDRIIIVHGGGKQVDVLINRLGEPIDRIDGIRLTPPSQMGLIAGVLAGEVNLTLVGALQKQSVRAVGLSLGSSGVLSTHVDPRFAEAGGRVGLADTGEAPLVELLASNGYVPVISSIGIDAEGGLLNINADDAAGSLASSLGASTLVFVSDVSGVSDAQGKLIERINADEVETLIADGVVTGGMAAKLRAAAQIANKSHTEIVITNAEQASLWLSKEPCSCTRLIPAEVSA